MMKQMKEHFNWKKLLNRIKKNDCNYNELIVPIDMMNYNNNGFMDMVSLCRVLKNNTYITKLVFDYHKNLSTAGIMVLSNMIRSNHTIQTLSMNHCNLYDKNIKAIAQAILQNPSSSIKELYFDYNHITNDGTEWLAMLLHRPKPDYYYRFQNDNDDSDNIKRISDAMKENNNNNNNDIINNIGLAAAIQNNNTNLSSMYETFHSKKLLSLSSSTFVNIRVLSLNGNMIGDFGIITLAFAIQYNDVIKTLLLNENNMGDIGYKALYDILYNYNDTLIELSILDKEHNLTLIVRQLDYLIKLNMNHNRIAFNKRKVLLYNMYHDLLYHPNINNMI